MESSPKPFLFNQSFDTDVLAQEAEQQTAPSFSETELHTAREQAYGQGFVAGKEAALAEAAQTQNGLLGNLERLFGRMAEEVWNVYAGQKQAAAELALAMARRIVPDYLAKHGVQEMTAQIAATVAEMINEPRLVLRVGDAHFDFVSGEVNALTQRLGFAGKMIVLADSSLSEHDCRLEWADGGMERNVGFTWSELSRQVASKAGAALPRPAPNPELREARPSTSFAV